MTKLQLEFNNKHVYSLTRITTVMNKLYNSEMEHKRFLKINKFNLTKNDGTANDYIRQEKILSRAINKNLKKVDKVLRSIAKKDPQFLRVIVAERFPKAVGYDNDIDYYLKKSEEDKR